MLTGQSDLSFTLLNFGAGQARVSGSSELSIVATKALVSQWQNPLTLREVCTTVGYKLVDSEEEADFNLALESLSRSTFVEMFER